MKIKIIALAPILLAVFNNLISQTCEGTFNHPILEDSEHITAPFTPTTDPPGPPDPPISHNGDRIVYWVHGLQGNAHSWAQASAALSIGSDGFAARKIFSLNPEYPEFDLDNAAWFVHQKLVEEGDPVNIAIGNPNPKFNFIVAHSQGGIVSRSVDKMYIDTGLESERRFGGLVTFGTAHQGAQILNNFEMIIDYADAACTEMTAGPLVEEILDNFWLDFFVNEDNILETADMACTFVSEHILPIALSNFTPPITDDYKVGAPQLAELNQTPHQIPMIAVYGIEEEPVLWRTIQYLGIDNPNDFEPWGANEDDKLIESVQTNVARYLLKYIFWSAQVQLMEEDGLPCTEWWQWVANASDCAWYDDNYWRARKLRDNWLRGVQWLTQANHEFKIMIGALTPQVVPEYFCVCYDSSNGLTITPSLTGECGPGFCEVQTGFSIEWIEKESDGVVLAESAGNMPGADYSIMLPKTSHMQMRNSAPAKDFFEKLLNGTYGNYFKTEER